MNSLEFLAPIGTLAVIFGSVISIIKISADQKLKRRLIDKSLDPELVRAILLERKQSNIGALKWGLVMVGLGLALAIGSMVGDDKLTAALMLLFGGMGFVIFYLITLRQDQQSGPETYTISTDPFKMEEPIQPGK